MDFYDDKEKMKDFYKISKNDFLSSYSYLNEHDYLETQKAINNRFYKIIETVKSRIVLNQDILSANEYFYKNDNFEDTIILQNVLLYLAEKYNIEIPEKAKEFIKSKLVFYMPNENTYKFINRKNEENVNVKPYLKEIKKKVIEERKALEEIKKEVVFSLNGKEILSYDFLNEFAGERTETIKLLANEHKCNENDIKVTYRKPNIEELNKEQEQKNKKKGRER